LCFVATDDADHDVFDAELGQGKHGNVQGGSVTNEPVIMGAQDSCKNDRVKETHTELNALTAENVKSVLDDRQYSWAQGGVTLKV